MSVVEDQRVEHPLESLRAVASVLDIEVLQRAATQVYVDPLIGCWIVDLVRSTREVAATAVGASVRGSLALERAVRGWALVHGRDYVVPTDVEFLFLPVVGHRVVFTPSKFAEARQIGMAASLASFESECMALAPAPSLAVDDPSSPAEVP
jgi:MoxR-like ATPase